MATLHHVQTSIETILKMDDEKIEALFDMPASDLRIELYERKEMGHRLIGSEGCIGFDPINGCPGHDTSD